LRDGGEFMNRRETFNSVILDYDYARPLYPKKLFDDIVAYSNLKVNAKILEVGAGTGQATERSVSSFIKGKETMGVYCCYR